MSMIQINHLSFTYPESYEPVFEDVCIQLDTDWKLGLIGRNGCGKTTLLKLLQGLYDYQGIIHASTTFDYFPSPIPSPNALTMELAATLCPLAEEWQLRRECQLLAINADDIFYRPFSTLSGGEQTKFLLACLFLNNDHFLLIDEPTNHLDAHAREVVAAYLSRKKGFILVSHDRAFLDACVDHILAINRHSIDIIAGNYSIWKEAHDKRETFETRQNKRLQKEIQHLQDAASRTADWSDRVERSKIGAADKGYVGHMAAKMMKRSKATLARREKAIAEKSSLLIDHENEQPLKLTPLFPRVGTLLRMQNVQIIYDDQPIGAPVSLTLHRGDRLFLDGPNGAGKSSLLALASGQPLEHLGTCQLASGLIISTVPQHTDHLHGDVITFARSHNVDLTLFLSFLRKMGFSRSHFEKEMAQFSEGQKKKVLLAKSLSESADLYIWDEPLNYIDLYSRLQIEKLIQTYQPTMLLVEHDRSFRDTIATDVITLP